MREIEGDLLDLAEDGLFDVIIHGCNCFNKFGAGIALEIKKRYPWVYKADQLTTCGSRDKLGSYTGDWVEMQGITELETHSFYVVNGYTQWKYGKHAVMVNYDAVEELFNRVNKDFNGKRIGIPRIGAGLARGDWGRISRIIDDQMISQDVTLVVLPEKV